MQLKEMFCGCKRLNTTWVRVFGLGFAYFFLWYTEEYGVWENRGLWKKHYRTAGAGATQFLEAERAEAVCTARSEALHRAQSRGVPPQPRPAGRCTPTPKASGSPRSPAVALAAQAKALCCESCDLHEPAESGPKKCWFHPCICKVHKEQSYFSLIASYSSWQASFPPTFYSLWKK